MDRLHIILFGLLFIAVIGFIVSVVYLIKQNKQVKANMVRASSTDTTTTTDNVPLTFGSIILIIIIFGLFIALVGFGIYTTLKRYELADLAIKRGDHTAALAILAPEIGAGIGSGISSILGGSGRRH